MWSRTFPRPWASDGADTVGGLVYGLLGKVPEGGKTVRCVGVRFTVEEVERRRIVSLRVARERAR